MSASTAAQAGRRLAAAGMVDQCTIHRDTLGTYNPATLGYGTTTKTLVYSGPCRLRPYAATAREAEVGERPVADERFVLAVPFAEPDVRVRDVVTMTESLDPSAAGQTFRVIDVATGTDLTARRLTVGRFI